MISNLRQVLSLAAIGVLAGGSLLAQAQKQDAKAMTLSGGDSKFAMEAARGGLAEVAMGKLAVEKASNPDVKAFGQRMVDDHSKANEELKSIAGQKNITLPTDTDPKHKAAHDRLSTLSGAEFDKLYMRMMVADHKKDVAAFRKQANSGKDQDLKAFASKTLPTLEEHNRMVMDLNRKVASGANSADRMSTDPKQKK